MKKGDKIYFSFNKFKGGYKFAYGPGVYFKLFNEYTSKNGIPIDKLSEYVDNIERTTLDEYFKVYCEMEERDYDTYSL